MVCQRPRRFTLQLLDFVRQSLLALSSIGPWFLLLAACASSKPAAAVVQGAPSAVKPRIPQRVPQHTNTPAERAARAAEPWIGIQITEELVPVIGQERGLKLF